MESIAYNGSRQDVEKSNALTRLLGTHDDDNHSMLRVALPNNVVLACPWRLFDNEPFEIIMACQTKSAQSQVVEFQFTNASMGKVTASYWK